MIDILKRAPRRDLHPERILGIFPRRQPGGDPPRRGDERERFLSLDLNYGRRIDSEMYEYLLDNGMTREEYHFFLEHQPEAALHHRERLLHHQRASRVRRRTHRLPSGEVFGYAEITRQYYNRYRLPVMHTETNLCEGPNGDEAVHWLWKEWANVLRIRNVGIPTVGFTWYSLTDQVDWDTALREQNGNVNPLGLYDLDRNIRNVGRAYKKLIADWRDVLPASSLCLVVPIRRSASIRAISRGCCRPLRLSSPGARRRTRRKHELVQDRQDRDFPACRRAGCSFASSANEGAFGWGEASLEGWAEAVDGAFEPIATASSALTPSTSRTSGRSAIAAASIAAERC